MKFAGPDECDENRQDSPHMEHEGKVMPSYDRRVHRFEIRYKRVLGPVHAFQRDDVQKRMIGNPTSPSDTVPRFY